MQPNVHISTITTLPRRSARRRGASTFSQMSLASSGASPRSGREVTLYMEESPDCTSACRGAHPNKSNEIKLINKRFIVSLLDGFILRKLPYVNITEI